ncbi:MAG: hypothetical protein V5A88_07245 [Candidatus Thermoplasmatota archaeon]
MLTLVLADCEMKISPEAMRSDKLRPEMVHFPLLLTQDSELAEERELRTIVHTRDDKIFQFESDARVPDDLGKFKKMMLRLGQGDTFQGVHVLKGGLLEVLEEQVGEKIVMTPKGEEIDPTERMSRTEDYVMVIGGFSKGDFRSPVYRWADKEVSISKRAMKPWSVTAETLVGYRYCSLE